MSNKRAYQINTIAPGFAQEGQYIEVPAEWVTCANRRLAQVISDYRRLSNEFNNCCWFSRPCSAKSVRALKSVWDTFVASVDELYEKSICRFNYDCTMATDQTDMANILKTVAYQDNLFGTLGGIYWMLGVAGFFFDKFIFSKLDEDEEITASNQEYGFIASFRCILEAQLEQHLLVL